MLADYGGATEFCSLLTGWKHDRGVYRPITVLPHEVAIVTAQNHRNVPSHDRSKPMYFIPFFATLISISSCCNLNKQHSASLICALHKHERYMSHKQSSFFAQSFWDRAMRKMRKKAMRKIEI
ncbi:hypothetical protein RvY_01953 [Ramazzottius varieornatus]|uniref:Uncharacterized protein n=1 Tax=Ramazzottius varieornatus TaxID=947166 RepID=A0A1D1UT95_RAMVA|nr:hypothetical protein RvY_01953 [Ramazzottius varieornatus]